MREYDINKNIEIKTGGGISVCSILGLFFVACKVFGVINWSWWLVLLPFWGPVAVGIAIVVIAIIIAGFMDLFSKDE